MERVLRSKPRAYWLMAIAAAGVPCSAINTLPEMLAEPQTEAIGMLQTVPNLERDIRLIALPYSSTAGVHRSATALPRWESTRRKGFVSRRHVCGATDLKALLHVGGAPETTRAGHAAAMCRAQSGGCGNPS